MKSSLLIKIFIISFIFLFFLQGTWLYYTFQREKINIETTLNELVLESIDREMDIRFLEIEKRDKDKTEGEGKSIQFKFNNIENESAISQQFEFMQQVLIAENLPFNISIADSIYNSLLQKNNIPFKFQINYMDADNKTVETTGSKIKNGFKTNIIPVVNGTKVQMVVKIDPPVVFRKMLWIFSISVTILLLIITCIIYEIRVFITQHQLEELRKNFTNSLTHNMKTPLATIYTVLDQVSKGNLDKNPEMKDKFSQIAINETEKLQAIVNRILTIARIEKKQLTLNKQPIDLPQMIRSLREKFTLKGEKIILFSEKYDLKDAIVYADPFYLCDALGNLIDNAIKYSEKTVRIDIECVADEKQIYIRIKDNGFGISSYDQRKIFEPFERGNEINRKKISGFGLGLNYVKQVIVAHGGEIALSSQENIGSEFTIILPSVLLSMENELSDYGQN